MLVSRRRFLHCAFSGPNLEPEFILFSGIQTTCSQAGDAASERHSDESAHINSRSVSVALPTWKERRQWRRWWCADRFQIMSPVEQTELISLHYGLVFTKLVGGARMSYSCLTHSAGDTLRSENVKQTRSRVQAADVKIKKQEFLQFWRSIFFSTFIRYCKWLFNLLIIFSYAQPLFIAQDDNNGDVSDLGNQIPFKWTNGHWKTQTNHKEQCDMPEFCAVPLCSLVFSTPSVMCCGVCRGL